MSNFSVQFDAPINAVQIAGEMYPELLTSETADVEIDDPESQIIETNSDIAETTKRIEAALKDVLMELLSQRTAFQAAAADYALEIVHVFLRSTDEITQQRLRENVARVLDSPDTCSVANLYVHPSCRESIEQWIAESELSDRFEGQLMVLVDEQLSPGDCRVDFGQSGRLAALDEQMKLVATRLKQTIRDDQNGSLQ